MAAFWEKLYPNTVAVLGQAHFEPSYKFVIEMISATNLYHINYHSKQTDHALSVTDSTKRGGVALKENGSLQRMGVVIVPLVNKNQ